MSVIHTLASKEELDLLQTSGKSALLFFWADWHEPSKVGGQMDGVLEALSQKYSKSAISFFRVEAEEIPAVSEALEVSVVPSFIAVQKGKIIGKVEGANPPEVGKLVKKLADAPPPVPVNSESIVSTEDRLVKLVNSAPVMLFMKGVPGAPRCGFSRQMCELLAEQSVPFATFDILTDEDVRSGLKTLYDWPTYPQLYVNGELHGGLDIVKEMVKQGYLLEQLGLSNIQLPPAVQTLDERLRSLIDQAPVMLFMKGKPDEPRCGFSRTICELLTEESVQFSTFDILTDDEVRSGLKTFSDWPTYPQLYVNGTLVGGLDIVKEMKESGTFKEDLGLVE
jgi:Grx4 family monothiol glutaredoxin